MDKFFRAGRWRACWAGALVLLGGGGTVARGAVVPIPPPTFAPATVAKPAAPARPVLDELVYRNGDRVHGHLLRREGDLLVFQSEQFGLLRVPAAAVQVVLAKKPKAAVAAKNGRDDKADADLDRWPLSPLALAADLKEFFGHWHGRFAFATEMMTDSTAHEDSTLEGHLRRKWAKDEVQLNGRYEFASANGLTSTDLVKADGSWRHDLPDNLFGVYRPTLEWNRAFFVAGAPADYVLLQQEAGVGVNLLNTDPRKLRVGVSENLFDTWVTPTRTHFSQNVESVFAEVEAKLPWRITLTDRGVYYYSFVKRTDGWENRFEIDKKLTETVTIGISHEIRHNNPDVRSADYRRLRMLLGFDF